MSREEHIGMAVIGLLCILFGSILLWIAGSNQMAPGSRASIISIATLMFVFGFFIAIVIAIRIRNQQRLVEYY